jgi:hypothetical protein
MHFELSPFAHRSVVVAVRSDRRVMGPRAFVPMSKQFRELVDREVRISNDGAQQRFFDGPTRINGHYSPNLLLKVNQDAMASF